MGSAFSRKQAIDGAQKPPVYVYACLLKGMQENSCYLAGRMGCAFSRKQAIDGAQKPPVYVYACLLKGAQEYAEIPHFR